MSEPLKENVEVACKIVDLIGDHELIKRINELIGAREFPFGLVFNESLRRRIEDHAENGLPITEIAQKEGISYWRISRILKKTSFFKGKKQKPDSS